MDHEAAILARLRARWQLDDPGSLAPLTDDPTTLAEADALAGPAGDDVVLAWGCLLGLRAAIGELEEAAIAPAAIHARSSGLPPEVVEEAVQLARVRLIVGDEGKPPALRSYRGRGSLAAFVRTVVVRIAIDLTRADRETPHAQLEELMVGEQRDPELEYMRERYAAELATALRSAWELLQPHDRFILELQLHHKLDLEAIAKVYAIHRATAVRRAGSARAALVALARAALCKQLQVGDTTVDSILRIVTTSVAWGSLDRAGP